MEIPNFRLDEQEYEKITVILARLTSRSDARSICLINRNGQAIAQHGQVDGLDLQALASLAASNLAATFGLASLIGENEFKRIYHRGQNQSIMIIPVGDFALILVVLPVDRGDRLDLRSLAQGALILEDILGKCQRE